MNNLTTRKIVLGLLMALVLALGVQGTADALTFETSRSGDLITVSLNQPFEITFDPEPNNPVEANPDTRAANQAEMDAANAANGNPNTVGNPNVGYQHGTTTYYYNTTNNNNTPADTADDFTVKHWLTESNAYYYNDEAVTVDSGITLTRNGTSIPGNGSTDALLDKHENSNRRLGSSITLMGSHAIAGVYDITITDSTPLADFPTDARPSGTRNSIEFIVYVVRDRATSPAIPALLVTSENYKTNGNDFTDQLIATPVGTGNTNFRIEYTVVEGPGQLYVQVDGPPIRMGSADDTLSTSNAASVRLDMNGGTNKVRATAAGAAPATAIFIFGYPNVAIQEDSNNQEGVFGGRLEDPLVVRVTDGEGSAISGLAAKFDIGVGTGGMFIPVSDTTVYITAAGVLAENFGAAVGGTRTATATRPLPAADILVQTDPRGEAKTYFQLGTQTSQSVTVTVGGVTPIVPRNFRFTAGSGERRPTLSILSGNNQRTDSEGDIEDPLIVVVRKDGNLQPDEGVTFRTVKGTLVDSNGADAKRATETTDGSGRAQVTYYQDTGEGSDTVTATISGNDYEKTVTFNINGSGGSQPSQPAAATNTITISPLNATGEPGEEVTINVASSPSGVFATLGSNDFGATRFSPQSGVTPFTSTLLLPVEEGTHSFFATGGVLTAGSASVTVEIGILGTISITQIGTPSNGAQSFSITVVDTDSARISGSLTVRVSGSGFTTRNVDTLNGIGNARLTLPTAASLYTLTASAEGYTSGTTQVRIAGTGQQQVADEDEEEVEEEVTVAAEPDSIEITGPSTRSGTVNEELDTPLLVRVLDDDGDGLEGARVFYRVISGRGRLSARGNGRAIGVVTDSSGYARAVFTPLDGGTITVRANTDDLSATVEFTITTGSAPGTRDAGTGVTPGASTTPGTISPVVHVAAASRPPMLWVDGGAIYALVGASPQRFAPSVDNALNITVAGGKVYWTEKTGESGGTINSANLNGSGVTELASIFATPMGIAVDVTNSKLYWTNSAGRIQSANLDGSRITNELQNLASPMDIALAGGNAYWTQGGNVRFVNLRGQKVVRNVSTGMDTAGSLAIGGGKVYWTETTGESGGTVNSANLNGTGATQLASILAAPIGIAVDGSRSKLYWSNSRGRIQSANLDGSGIKNVVSGLGSPGELVLSNSIATPTAATTTTRTTTTASKYDLNSDGTVDNTDAGLVADAMGTSNTRYDVNGDGTVNFLDLLLVFDNRDPGAAGAPTIVGMKLSAAQIDIIEEQIDLLIATNDRSPAAMRTLVYLQQLLVTARPEKTQLLANYPNPFNPETWIPYELATDTDVRITIYNTQGVVIRSLQFGHQSAGYYTGRDRAAYWDGRNALGEQVASGLYFYQLETDEMSLMRKMVILK